MEAMIEELPKNDRRSHVFVFVVFLQVLLQLFVVSPARELSTDERRGSRGQADMERGILPTRAQTCMSTAHD